tara:strand:- start:1273 stop:2094 length:822 start_codon:yes stop_codon:yes gene_type:complete
LCDGDQQVLQFLAAILAMAVALCVAAFVPAVAHAEAMRQSPIGIQGRDDRSSVEVAGAPWRSIGRINNSGRSFCTGVLIGEDRVLTAAHCLRSHVAGRTWAPPSAIRFLAGYSKGQYSAHSQAIALTIAPSLPGRATLESDFAIVTLARPIGRTHQYLPVEAFDRDRWLSDRKARTTYDQAGYSQDRAQVLTRHMGCDIVDFPRTGQVFAHSCDATHGDSGSPILARRDNGYAVVGLHIASSRNGRSGIAISGYNIVAGLARLQRVLPVAYKR